MEYWLISTVDDKGNKALGGGMMKRQSPQQHGINYFDVKSVQEYSAKVEQLGGKVIIPNHPCQAWVIWLYAQIQRTIALVFLK
jgi:predicted enzyme related to lactoylglutathione lyase